MKYSWLLFDADETLFDYSTAETNALKMTLEQAGLAFQPDYFNLYGRFNRQVWQEFERGEIMQLELRTKRFRLFFEQAGLEADPHAISAQYLRNLGLQTDLLPGAERVVLALKARHPLALVTNGLAEVQLPRLEHSRLAGCFEQVFISELLGAAKPSAAYFDAVFDAIGRPPRKQVLIVGDSLTADMQGGLDYGMATCWYNPGGKSTELAVTHQIARLDELLLLSL